MSESWATASKELSLDEILAEPIVQMMMRRDGVRIQELHSHLTRAHKGMSGTQQRYT